MSGSPDDSSHADEQLWALDLDAGNWPILAHLIVRTEQGRFGEVRTAACGRAFTGTHSRGWWSTRRGTLPLQRHAVHCGADQVEAHEPDPTETELRTCADCGVFPGESHEDGCDVARCLHTGLQRLSCLEDHDHGRDMWTGRWPGTAECEEFGWYSVFTSHGWVRCDRDERGASPDLNRLHLESAWDRDQLRWVRL